MGRFISEDPLWGSIWDPQSLNRFAYGRNNPFRYVDPSGMKTKSISFDDLMDPDGRKYQTNTDTGEIRYEGDSNFDDDGSGGIWSGWKDPNYSSTDPFDAAQDEYKKNDSMKELHDFLNEFESATVRIEKYLADVARGKVWVRCGLEIGGIGVGIITIGHLAIKEAPVAGTIIMGGGLIVTGIGTTMVYEGMKLQGY